MPMLDFILMNTGLWDAKFQSAPADTEQSAEETPKTEEQNTNIETEEQPKEETKQDEKQETQTTTEQTDEKETAAEQETKEEPKNDSNTSGFSAEEMSEIDAIFKHFEDPSTKLEIDQATIDKLEQDTAARNSLIDALLAKLKANN